MSEARRTYQFLSKLRPSGVAPELIFSPKTGQQVIVKLIYVVNVSNKDRKFSIYFDNRGAATDETTAIAFEAIIEKNTTQPIELDIPMRNSAGTLHVQTDKADDINFQLMGDK